MQYNPCASWPARIALARNEVQPNISLRSGESHAQATETLTNTCAQTGTQQGKFKRRATTFEVDDGANGILRRVD